jgi:hypothetical protein
MVSVPLALAPEVFCVHDRELLDALNVRPSMSIPPPEWKPEIAPLRCDDGSSCSVPPLEKTTPLAVPPDATSSLPPLIAPWALGMFIQPAPGGRIQCLHRQANGQTGSKAVYVRCGGP